MNFKYYFVVFMVITIFVDNISTIRWLAVQHANLQWNATNRLYKTSERKIRSHNHSLCAMVRKYYGFSKFQTRICRTTTDIMSYVQKAASLAAETCKNAFQYRRWNCSSIDLAPQLTPDLTRGTREQAYVYAISSAALTFTVAKLCASGLFHHHCSCGENFGDPPSENFKWGGCNDNTKWGINFSRHFIDSMEKYSWKNLHADNKDKLIQKQKAMVNLHNNRVGRRVIGDSIITQCKCHGISGSCSIKTCWKSVPSMNKIAEVLLKRYVSAIELPRNYSDYHESELGYKTPPSKKLIYFTKSPDYCTKDPNLGSFGTKSRKCNITSSAMDGCKQMCCGRGFKTILEEKIERCQCKYYYCCYVKCKTCRTILQTYRCN